MFSSQSSIMCQFLNKVCFSNFFNFSSLKSLEAAKILLCLLSVSLVVSPPIEYNFVKKFLRSSIWLFNSSSLELEVLVKTASLSSSFILSGERERSSVFFFDIRASGSWNSTFIYYNMIYYLSNQILFLQYLIKKKKK